MSNFFLQTSNLIIIQIFVNYIMLIYSDHLHFISHGNILYTIISYYIYPVIYIVWINFLQHTIFCINQSYMYELNLTNSEIVLNPLNIKQWP